MADVLERMQELKRRVDGKGWQQVCLDPLEFIMFVDQASYLNDELRLVRGEMEDTIKLLNTPEVEDFDKAIPLEAAHQVERWGAEHDAGKAPADWFWLVGFLAGKALAAHIAGNIEKAKHHCISTAAVLRNWHAHIRSGESHMRPGLGQEKTLGLSSGGDEAGTRPDFAFAAGFLEEMREKMWDAVLPETQRSAAD